MIGLALKTGNMVRHDTAAMARQRIAELAGRAKAECLAFNAGAPHGGDEPLSGSPAGRAMPGIGVEIRAVYQESFRNAWHSLAQAHWLAEVGAQVRSVPRVPAQMVIYDREVALLPLAEQGVESAGMVEVRSPDVLAVLCGMFEQVWSDAQPLGDPVLVDGNGLDAVERELLKLLSDGHTDASAGRKLGVSVRTVQRMMADLTGRLKAESRFQAGVAAVRLGWL